MVSVGLGESTPNWMEEEGRWTCRVTGAADAGAQMLAAAAQAQAISRETEAIIEVPLGQR